VKKDTNILAKSIVEKAASEKNPLRILTPLNLVVLKTEKPVLRNSPKNNALK
jgi:hypothetical protein